MWRYNEDLGVELSQLIVTEQLKDDEFQLGEEVGKPYTPSFYARTYEIVGDSDYLILWYDGITNQTGVELEKVGQVVTIGQFRFKLLKYNPISGAWLVLRVHGFNTILYYKFIWSEKRRWFEFRLIRTLCIWGFGKIPYPDYPRWEHVQLMRKRLYSMTNLALLISLILVLF